MHGHLMRHTLFLLAACGALVGCAGVPLAPSDTDRAAKQALPPAGQALIFVVRNERPGRSEPAPIAINGRIAGTLSSGTYLLLSVAPGLHEIASMGQATLVAASAGRNYFVRFDLREHDGRLQPRVSALGYAEGRKQVGQTRLIQDGYRRVAGTLADGQSAAAVPAPDVPAAAMPTPSVPAAASPQAAVAPVAPRSGVSLSVSMGNLAVAQAGQTVASVPMVLAGNAKGVLGLEAEYRTAAGMALGVEILNYRMDYTQLSGASGGAVDATSYLGSLRYYLQLGRFAPFAGFLLGSTQADFSGALQGTVSGPTFGGALGLEWQFLDRAALAVEYRGLYASLKSKNGEKVDLGTGGTLLGLRYWF